MHAFLPTRRLGRRCELVNYLRLLYARSIGLGHPGSDSADNTHHTSRETSD